MEKRNSMPLTAAANCKRFSSIQGYGEGNLLYCQGSQFSLTGGRLSTHHKAGLNPVRAGIPDSPDVVFVKKKQLNHKTFIVFCEISDL
jgi:hypothetical protein